MLYLFISIILFVLIALFLCAKIDDEDLLCYMLLAVVVILLAIPLFNTTCAKWEETEQETLVYKITGLELSSSNNQYVNGAFILGTGFISGGSSTELQYVFFSNNKYGKKLRTIGIKNTYLRETNKEKPQLRKIEKIKKRKANIIDKLWGTKEEYITITTDTQKRILIVPKNTIKIEYNVNI